MDRSLSVDAVLTFVAAGGPAHVVSRARGLYFLSGSLMNLPRMGARAVDGLGGKEIEVTDSPILGAAGNREFLLHAVFARQR